jgi:hypothetical protein
MFFSLRLRFRTLCSGALESAMYFFEYVDIAVAADLQQIRIFIDEDRLEAPLEQMPPVTLTKRPT